MRICSLTYLLAFCGALLFAACSDDTDVQPDTGTDGAMPDLEVVDSMVDMVPDTTVPPDASTDTSVPVPDASPDQMQPDAMQPDAMLTDAMQPDAMQPDAMQPDAMLPDATQPDATPTAASAMYFTGSSSSALSAYNVKLDGTGKVKVAGLPSVFDLDYGWIYGRRREYAHVNKTRPQLQDHITTSYKGTLLPGTLGSLYYYIVTSSAGTAGRGFFVARPDGTTKVLDFAPGSGTTGSYHYNVGANETGTIIAAVKSYSSASAAIKLLRTDGQNFGSTTSGICDITPTTPAVNYIYYYIYFTAQHVYFKARDASSSSQYYLFRAPLDCSAKATQVTLPTVGGAAVSYIHNYMTQSLDGKTLALAAGSSSTNTDIIVVDDATGTATNISTAPADYDDAGYYLMYYASSGSHIDISPNSKMVAYVKYASPKRDLYLRPVDKSATAVQITTATNFSSSYDTISAVQWANDDELFFWAGTSTTALDMFRYKVSTSTLTQITTTGGTTKPYSGTPTARPYGGWIAPNGKYIYFVQYDASGSGGSQSNIRVIDRAAGTVKDITSAMYVSYSDTNIVGTLQGDKVFYHAETGSSTGNDANLYVFDQNAATAPVKLTSFSATNYIYDIIPNTDGSLVTFNGGSSSSSTDLYVVEVKATPVVNKVTASSGYVSDMKAFTADNKSVLFGTGSSSSGLNLQLAPITGGTPTVLDSTTGYTSVIMAY
jgi:pentapeptide MXKDX repeat protein